MMARACGWAFVNPARKLGCNMRITAASADVAVFLIGDKLSCKAECRWLPQRQPEQLQLRRRRKFSVSAASASHRFTETVRRTSYLFLRNSGRKTAHTFPGIALVPDHPGVDIQRLAGDPASVLARQERYDVGDMLGLALALHRLQHLDEAERLVVRARLDAIAAAPPYDYSAATLAPDLSASRTAIPSTACAARFRIRSDRSTPSVKSLSVA